MQVIRNRTTLNILNFLRSSTVTRTYSVQLQAPKEGSDEKSRHIFTESFTEAQLIDHLISSVIYKKNGIVVCDKPYGIGRWRQFEVKNVRSNFRPKTFETLSLKDVMDEMANKLGYEALKIQKGPDRYASGIMVLTANEKAEKRLTSFIWRADSITTPDTYLVVTCGNPCKRFNTHRYGLQLDEKTKSSDFVDTWSINSQKKRGEVFGFNVHHEVLSSSEFGSLVKVNVNTNKHNALRLYMVSKCLSPILGDDRFGSRTVKMGDVVVDLGPRNLQSKKRLKLPPELLQALNLEENDSDVVPVHMHLYSFPFLKKGLKEYETQLIIPPPKWFIWTCHQLKLDIDSALKIPIKRL